jgi:flagellar biosynthetic protein FliR
LNPIGTETALATFVLFCRIGGCLMLMPGISSPRVPVQIRLFLAIAVTLAVTPLLLPSAETRLAGRPPHAIPGVIVGEIAIGALIGLAGRLYFAALEFMATSVAMYVGYGNIPGVPIEETEPLPAVATLLTTSATVLFFLTNQHTEVLRALLEVYAALPVAEALSVELGLTKLTRVLSDAFVLTLQITSPFLLYAILINMMFGLANKLVPQIPVFFISVPFVVAGGLLLLYLTLADVLRLFISGFSSWLATL